MEYKAQYQEYLLQATAALDVASARFLPEESEVCRAARYSLLGGGKRIRAILTLSVCDMLGGAAPAAAAPIWTAALISAPVLLRWIRRSCSSVAASASYFRSSSCP